MNILVLCSLWALAASYEHLNDSFNITALVEDIDELKKHLRCYLDKGPCEGEAAQYRQHIQEVLDDACRECNDVQKHQFKLFFFGTKEKLPAEFEELRKKYDPSGIHFQSDVDTLKAY